MVGSSPTPSATAPHAASTDRRSARPSERAPERIARREPHQKYDLPPERWPPGLKAEWKALTIKGMTNRNGMIEYYRAGWQPARAEQFPEFSGYGLDLGGGTIPMGFGEGGKPLFLENVKAGDPVVLDGQILMLRPIELCDEAEAARQKASNDQVETQIQRLSGQSKRDIGAQRTTVQRKFVGRVDEE